MKEKKHYTLVLVPHDGKGEVLKLRFSRSWLYGAVALFMATLFLVSLSLVYSAALSRRLAHYSLALRNEENQQQVIDQFSLRSETLRSALQDLSERDNELRKMLGLRRKELGLNLVKFKLETPAKELEGMQAQVLEKKKSLAELKDRVKEIKRRFVYTPSIWPVRGPISSYFGFRRFPWRGFHSGVDINTGYGVAVKATAAGKVLSAGWIRGYGQAIVLEHGYGLTTLYGHLSRFAIKQGQVVSKGQLIGYVGTTGYTTGPHLHYEVRWASIPVNPVRYLNMNLFTASRIWRE